MDEKGLGKVLQQARKSAGLTQQELCHRANLSFSTLTKIERGAIKAPSIFTVQSIAQAIDMSLDELLGNTTGVGKQRALQKTKSGVSFIYFDVNGCLVHFFQAAFIKLAEATGAQADVVETAFWHYNDEVCKGVITLDEFNEKLAKRLNVDAIRWQDYYLETIEPIPQMHDTLRWAAERYRVGLLTNIMPGLLTALKRAGHVPDIAYDAVIDSSEVGAIKPEAHVYEVAQAQANCPAEEILLIDDSRANLMAAEKQGWNVLWFDDARPDSAAARVREALQPAD